ncbi:MAG: Adenylate cyclase, partial [uncultured Gemmatimonadaceae bacterium]
AATTRAPSRSVAVLPFANVSGDPANEPFADGLTDELIGALGRVAALKVAPRTSTFALKGKGLGVRTVAESLGVATALEGSVRRAGDRLRITVALVSAAENRVLWSETYDRQLEDVFAIQQDIARSVVGALQVTLAASPAGRPAPPATADLAAYELFLKGQFFRNQQTGDALRRATGFFEQAIARDPGYARAHAGLADARTLLALFGDRPPRAEFPQARAAATTALRLDSTLAEAHGVLAHIAMVYDWDWAAADRGFERAIALDPTWTTARVWRAISLLNRRRFDEAVAVLEQARAADPLSAPVQLTLGRLYVSARQPDRAIPYLRGALELNPRLSLAHQQLGHAHLQQGVPTEARAAFERAAALGSVRDSAQLAYAYAVTGRRGDAESIVRTLLASAERRYLPPFGLAVAYVGLGDTDAAFRWLDRGHAERAAYMDGVAITPALAPLHADPRWGGLLGRLGLSAER